MYKSGCGVSGWWYENCFKAAFPVDTPTCSGWECLKVDEEVNIVIIFSVNFLWTNYNYKRDTDEAQKLNMEGKKPDPKHKTKQRQKQARQFLLLIYEGWLQKAWKLLGGFSRDSISFHHPGTNLKIWIVWQIQQAAHGHEFFLYSIFQCFLKLMTFFVVGFALPTDILSSSFRSPLKAAFLSKSKLQACFSSFICLSPKLESVPWVSFISSPGWVEA